MAIIKDQVNDTKDKFRETFKVREKIITEMMFIIHLMRNLGGDRQNGKKKKIMKMKECTNFFPELKKETKFRLESLLGHTLPNVMKLSFE